MTLNEDARVAYKAAQAAEAALLVRGPWAGRPLFEEDRAAALRAVRHLLRTAEEVIIETGGAPT